MFADAWTQTDPGFVTQRLPLPAVRFTPSLNLKALHFEVPGLSSDWLFTGRDWLFQEVDSCLRSSDPVSSKGVLIIGNMGFGKSAIIARLVALSCHGNRMWPNSCNQTMPRCEFVLREFSFQTGLFCLGILLF